MSELVLTEIHKRYGAVAALDGVSLRVPAGSRTAIVGPSGSGKTSLLRVVAGFETPDAGAITLGGQVLANGTASTPAHRRGVGVVAQDGALFPHLSVGENIGFGIEARAGRADRVAELIRMVGLEVSMLRRRADQLSGGQQQRVALARAMARQPRLMLLDEPFSGLDTGLRAEMRKVVGDLLAASNITTVLVTHDQSEALSFADQVAVMRNGRLVQTGTPRELYFRPRTPEVATFLGDAIILPAWVEGDGAVSCALGRLTLGEVEPGSRRPDSLGSDTSESSAPGTAAAGTGALRTAAAGTGALGTAAAGTGVTENGIAGTAAAGNGVAGTGNSGTDNLGTGGQVRILIRPEQVALLPAGRPGFAAGVGLPAGRVLAVEFGGPVCTVTLEVMDAAFQRQVVTIRHAGVETFRAGETVRIAVDGPVHAFAPVCRETDPR